MRTLVPVLCSFALLAGASAQEGSPIPPASPVSPVRPAGTTVRIELVGDSLMSQTFGFGLGICRNLTSNVDCINMGVGGTSTKTYRSNGSWATALAAKPDYMLIHLGANDVRGNAEHPNPRTTTLAEYEANIRGFITKARAANIIPVLITPMSRRRFGPDGKIDSDLEGNAQAERKIAADMKVPLIDLHAQSVAQLNEIGPSAQEKLSGRMRREGTEIVPDKTHINATGAELFGRDIAVGLGKAVPALAPDVTPEAAKLPPVRIMNPH